MDLQGSNDNTNWTTLDESNQTGWTQLTTYLYSSTVGNYRYKLVITANNSGGTQGLEIELKVERSVWIPANLSINETKADGFKYSQVASAAS